MLGSSAKSITLFSKLTLHYPSRENKAALSAERVTIRCVC